MVDFTKDELLNTIRLLDEQAQAYDNNRLSLYKPHAGQLAFHQSQKKIRLMVCGNRGGKSHASAMEGAWLALGVHPYHPMQVPNRGKIYAVSYAKIVETLLPKFLQYIPKSALDAKKPFDKNQMGQVTGINFACGSVIKVGSYDQQLMKAEGSDFDWCCFDEPPSRDLYVAEMRGLVDRGGLCWFSMTPLNEPWIYDDLWVPGKTGKKPYIDCFNWSSDKNPHINKESLQLFLDELTPEERAVRFEGQFKKLQGLVIKTYDPQMSDVEPFPLTNKFVIYEGLDPHTDKPNCALWKAIDKDGFRYAVRELKFDGGIYDFGQAIAEVREDLRMDGAEIVASISDTSLNQKDMMFKINQKDELERSLRDAGESVMPKMANKRGWLLPGIQKMIDLFRPIDRGGWQSPTEFLFEGMVPNYKHDLQHYQWPDNTAKETLLPIPRFNDFIDPSRYIESIAPKFITPGQSGIVRNNRGAYQRIA